MNGDQIKALAAGVAKVLRDELREELGRELADLRAEFNERLKALPVPVFRSVWVRGNKYEPASLVVYKGGLWHSNARTASQPGADDTWQLCVKSGTFRGLGED